MSPEITLAACTPPLVSDGSTVCDATVDQTTTVGTGPGTTNVTITVQPGATITTGAVTAISVNSDSTIILQNGANVINNSSALTGSGNWSTGENTIEFNNDTTLEIAPGAQVLSQGPTGSNEAINVIGAGNSIINHGLIQGNASSAIWFQPATGINTIDNYGTISILTPGGTAIGSSGTMVSIINRDGGSIIGNVSMGSGDDSVTLESGSLLEGNISGGGGTNTLTLTGAASSTDTLDLLAGNITNFQSLTKNGEGEWQLTGGLTNIANVTINEGTLALAGTNTYVGNTNINGGTLAAQAAGALSPNSAYIIAAPGAMDLNGFSQTIASVSNAGVINLNGADAATVLTVAGNYTGNNGRLNFNAKLSDDASQSERLIVGGDTSGDTQVTVNNAGGSGAQTIDGIELITVNGSSDGEFIQSGRIVAGAYDYTLARGTDVNAANWYLNSSTAAPTPEPPGAEPPSEPIPDPHPDPGDMVERPEDSSYGANLAAANTLFAASLNTRSGLTAYIDPITGQQQTTSLWMTNVGGHNRSRDDSGQLRTQSNRYVLQLGGDVGQWSSDGADSFRLGVMAGYGHARSNTDSQVSGYRSKGSVDGYSVGLYGTWYADAAGHDGLYVDGWTQYGWFDNEVNGQDLGEQDYKSKGFTASLETGYAFNIGANPAKNATYYIEPQAQAIWMDVKADDLTEDNGTRVSGDGDGNIQTRLGVKAYMNAYSERDKNKDRLFQPFIEANWIHNSKDFGATLNGVTVSQDGAANIGELKLGVNGKISKNLNLWGSVGQQVGNKGYSDTAGMLGVKYLF
ncbi:autotransporter outer membrane beta-barrel domain-containing protein [Sodalis sp. RH15]|uniref:autotransporter outer membrane beta-barrel domain-containing protein n=1 Tax=Sodalis sp. RH15 TaxID=3394330 RepID=UPI0039B4BF62